MVIIISYEAIILPFEGFSIKKSSSTFYFPKRFLAGICKLGVNEVPVNLFMTRLSSEILQKGVC